MLPLVLLAFFVRVYHLDYQSLWRDEVDALVFATRDLATVLGNFTKTGENGPLYFLLLRYWIGLAGVTEFSLRFFSLFFGVLVVPLVYAFGRWLLGREVAVFAALLAAVSPYYVWYSQEARMYALLTFLSLLSVSLCLRAIAVNRPRVWAACVVVTSLSLYVHFFAALVVLLEGTLFLLARRRRGAPLLPGAIAFGLLTLPYLPLAVWQVPTLLQPPPTAYPFLDFGSVLTTLVFSWSLSSSPVPVLFPLSAFTFLLLCGLLLHPFRARLSVLILVAYLLVPIAGFYLVSLRLPLFTDRYLIIASPAYYLLLACGLAAVRRRSAVALALALLVVLSTSGHGLWLQSHVPIKSDFRSAARYYAERSGGIEPVIFVMPYVQLAFTYYYRGPLTVRQAPPTNGGLTADQIATQLARELKADQRVWLVLSEEELYDARGAIKDWLDRNGRIVESERFARVALHRYEMSGATQQGDVRGGQNLGSVTDHLPGRSAGPLAE